MQRVLTAAVGVPLALLAVFRLPGWAFFLLLTLFFAWATLEFVQLLRPLSPRAPWRILLISGPLLAAIFVEAVSPDTVAGLAPFVPASPLAWFAVASTLALAPGVAVLAFRTPVGEAVPVMSILAWATLYFAVPLAAMTLIHRDPWLFFLLLAIVWLGDTAAYYCGSTWGRHKLAPTLSPKKSWEGAIAGFLTSVAATAVWSFWRSGEIELPLLAVAMAAAIAAQTGDLVESMAKRAAGVKDSGGVLPGHGGIYDRLDSMFFAAPVMLLGLWAIDHF